MFRIAGAKSTKVNRDTKVKSKKPEIVLTVGDLKAKPAAPHLHPKLSFKRTLVTSALPYVNGPLHVGHLRSTYIPADVYVRFLRMRGEDVVYICGSDEYGTPTVIAAEQEGLTPDGLVTKYHESAAKNFAAFNISFDHYGRTIHPFSHEITQHFFRRLGERGFLFKTIVKEYYCPTDKKFMPDRYIKGTCHACKTPEQYADYCEHCGLTFKPGDLIDPKCTLDKTTPQLKDSEHYIFKLTALAPQLRFFLQNANIKEEVKNYVIKWVEQLKDWDIVRDLNWGVAVPDMPGKVFYVWFNAPIGYISLTKEWAEKIGKPNEWEKYWKSPDSRVVHFIGKDIIYHHCLFWPGMLIGTNEFLTPDTITVRGFVTIQGKKISKSRKYWILLEDYLSRWPADYLRFYYSLTTPNAPSDGDFDWKDFQTRINKELLDNVGNFVHRTLTFVQSKFGGNIPVAGEEGVEEEALRKKLAKATKEVDRLLADIEVDKALKVILDLAQTGNQYFQKSQPWKKKQEDAATAIHYSVNLTRSIAILLAPYIPSSAEKLWDYLNFGGSVHSQKFATASEFAVKAGHKIKKPEPLFKKVEDEEIAKEVERLRALVG